MGGGINAAIMLTLVTAFSALPESGVPDEIVFIPEGNHRITPQSHPKGIAINMDAAKGESVAAAFNASLQKLRSRNVLPWLDFEHTRKFPASGYPTSFRYEAGRGLIAAVDWSGSGRRSIEDRDVRYFSPEFYVDANGIPNGLPERGPLGGLVTEPAFRESPAIAASDNLEDQTKTKTMSNRIFASLSVNPAAEDAENAAVDAIQKLKVEASQAADGLKAANEKIQTLTDQINAAEADAKAARAARAKSIVAKLSDEGKIPPKDEDYKTKLIERITAGDSLIEEILASLPSRTSDLTRPVITAKQTTAKVPGQHEIETKAQALVTAGQAKDLTTALGIVASESPELYTDYLATLV